MARRETSVAELSAELGVGRVTFYPYVDPGGALRENGRRVLAELGVLGGGQVYDRFLAQLGARAATTAGLSRSRRRVERARHTCGARSEMTDRQRLLWTWRPEARTVGSCCTSHSCWREVAASPQQPFTLQDIRVEVGLGLPHGHRRCRAVRGAGGVRGRVFGSAGLALCDCRSRVPVRRGSFCGSGLFARLAG